jgi:hypothetical protein
MKRLIGLVTLLLVATIAGAQGKGLDRVVATLAKTIDYVPVRDMKAVDREPFDYLAPGSEVIVLSGTDQWSRIQGSDDEENFIMTPFLAVQKKLTLRDVLDRVDEFEKRYDLALLSQQEDILAEAAPWVRLATRALGEGEVGKLPEQGAGTYVGDDLPDVTITNDTNRNITVYYSGPSARTMTIAPGATKTITLAAGSYNAVVRSADTSVTPFKGTYQFQLGYIYTVSYYIKTTIGEIEVVMLEVTPSS